LETTGTITSFSPTANGEGSIGIGGDRYWVETAGQSYSLTNPDPQTLRFEIHQGDKTAVDVANGEQDDRSQIDGSAGGTIPVGTPININYQFMLESNGANGSFTNTASWFVTGEMASTAYGASPPFAIELNGDHLQVVARYTQPGGNPSNSSPDLHMLTLWTDPNPIQTGQYNNISIQANVSQTSSGYLEVSVNGTQVVNYHGPLGYGAPTYWMYGLYRSPTSQTVAAKFRNMTPTTGAAPP
jgi:Polysaccharide lyase